MNSLRCHYIFKINTLITNNMKRMYNIMIVNIHFKVDMFFLSVKMLKSCLPCRHKLSPVIMHFFTDLPYVWLESGDAASIQKAALMCTEVEKI